MGDGSRERQRRGPKTPQGRARVRGNALKHGILSPSPVIPGAEQQTDWERHRKAVFESLAPVGYLEELHAERIALGFWRLNRVIRAEQASTISRRHEWMLGVAPDRAHLETISPDAIKFDTEFLAEQGLLVSAFKSADHQDEQPVRADLAVILLRKTVEQTGLDLDAHTFPDLPAGRWWKFEHWTMGILRRSMQSIAASLGEQFDRLMAALQSRLAQEFAASQREENRAWIEASRAENIVLPDPATLQVLTRYEAHLNRLLNQSLHELEALQGRRMGEAAPLARLDVNGLRDLDS